MDTATADKQVMLRTARVMLGEDGIARYVALPGAEVTLADAWETHQAIAALYAGGRYPLLVDIREVKSASREARNFFASADAATTTRAVALLVTSPVSRLIGNFFIHLSKPVFPVRLFTDEDECISWLEGFTA